MATNPLVAGISVKRPAHDEMPVQAKPTTVVATWPVGTFVENLCVGRRGQIYISIESLGEVQLLAEGAISAFVKPGNSVSGLAMMKDDLCVNTGKIGVSGWTVRRYSPAGEELSSVLLPDALFLNGSTLLRQEMLLVPDSILGRIYWVDFEKRTSGVWCQDELFSKISPEPMLPGINGLRVSGRTAYFTNTDRSLLGRISIDAEAKAGAVEIIADRMVGDDLAVAEDGSLFITNHVYNTLTRLHPSGQREVVAGPEQHMQGCTSAVFGRTDEARRSLFITTTGGILAPYEGRVREAKLLRVEVGIGSAAIGMGEKQ